MKRLILAVVAVMFLGAMPILAAEHGDMKMDPNEGVRQCALQAESVQEKIQRLQSEVKKGEKSKISPEELKKLESKLKEANELLDNLTK
jgi:uncharacterized protein YlxW (UPF0749 family)